MIVLSQYCNFVVTKISSIISEVILIKVGAWPSLDVIPQVSVWAFWIKLIPTCLDSDCYKCWELDIINIPIEWTLVFRIL